MYRSTVTASFTIAGSVESFDASAFRLKLLTLFPTAVDASITAMASSVSVDALVIYADQQGATSAAAQLQGMDASALSSSLEVTVTSVTSPTIAQQLIT